MEVSKYVYRGKCACRTKNFLQICTEIYRHLLSKCSKNAVLARPEIVQCKCFFLIPHRNMFAGKFVSFFERNRIVTWVIFFASFCWLWDFFAGKSEIKKNSDDVYWNVWTIMKKLYVRNNIFKKWNFKYEILNHLYFGPNFPCLVDCFRAF